MKAQSRSLRLLFAGSPAIALPCLQMIAKGALDRRWELAGVLTNPDTIKGRSGAATPTDVGREAAGLTEQFTALGLAPPVVLKPHTLRAEAREQIAPLKPDLLVSFAYGRFFGPLFLSLFPLGGINVHPSLLPKHRGASPIQEAILRQDSETGICIQRIAAQMDTGNILARETIALNGTETTASLSGTAAVQGAVLLQKVLEDVCGAGIGVLEGIPQEGEPSYCALLEKDSGLIDWSKSAKEISAQVRACNPWPLARTCHKGQVLNLLEAVPYHGTIEDSNGLNSTCTISFRSPGRVLGIDKKSGILIQTGDGVLAVLRLQYQTKKALHWQAFINGARDFTGSLLEGRF